MTIDGYYHVAMMGSWSELVREQLDLIRSSGLYDKTRKIHVTVMGEGTTDLFDDDKFDVQYRTDLKEYEFASLRRIAECDCDYLWYVHTKGVSHDADFNDWRRYMEYFIIEKHEDCIKALGDYDMCGVEFIDEPLPHYSGNFWWARGDHIKKLSSIDDLITDKDMMEAIGGDRLQFRHKAEFWLCGCEDFRERTLFWSGRFWLAALTSGGLAREEYEGATMSNEHVADIRKEKIKEWKLVIYGNGFHTEGDIAYHSGDLERAMELWGKGAELGHEQCEKNLEWVRTR